MSLPKPATQARRRSSGIGKVLHSVPFLSLAATLVLTGAGLATFLLTASGDQELSLRSVTLSSSEADATTTYAFGFTIASPAILGSIVIQFCSNDPLIEDPCVAPVGLDASGATLSSQTGEVNFTVLSETANEIILTRTAVIATPQPVTYTFDNIVNPSAIGSYYARLQTFGSENGAGSDIDHGGLAYAINDSFAISAKVPPYLLFCSGVSIPTFDCADATGDFVNFGDFSPNSTSTGQTQLLAASNAGDGYTISYSGITLTSGNNIIPGLATADVSRPGVSQFGINLAANQDPAVGQDVQGPGDGNVAPAYAQPNLYKFTGNDVVAIATDTQNYRKYTVSYIANIAPGQAAGVYDSTLTYICLASF